MEQFGEALVTGSYLKIAVALLALAVAGLVVLNVKTIHTFHNFKPLVIRIDELGRAQALSYDSFAYKPEAKEAKYFLTQFCELYYRRNRYTINDDFTKSLYFLDYRNPQQVSPARQKLQRRRLEDYQSREPLGAAFHGCRRADDGARRPPP